MEADDKAEVNILPKLEKGIELIRGFSEYENLFDSDWAKESEQEKLDDEKYLAPPQVKLGLPFPELSIEDNAIIDGWYDEYNELENEEQQLAMAKQFINEYPGLVPAWGFEAEHLLDLKSNCLEKGFGDEVNLFIIEFRNRFPDVYLREFGYYDSDLIYSILSKNNDEDIQPYLENFEKYPIPFFEQLFELVQILALKGKIDILIPFLKKIHKQVIDSDGIFGSYELLTPIILHIESKYLQVGKTDDQYIDLCNEIKKNIEVEIDEKYYFPSYWKQEHEVFFSKSEVFTCRLNNAKETTETYLKFIKQFLGYIHTNIINNWIITSYLGYELTNFIGYTITKNLVKKNHFFVINDKVLNKFIAQNYRNYLWIDSSKTNAFLNGLWYFADFLFKTGNATETEMLKIKELAIKFHETEQKINKANIESSVFAKFPLY